MPESLFITGTDTDVGKTVACAWAILHTGARYWKPVQAGLAETDAEMALFRKHSDSYGYVFYVLRAR